MKISVIIPAYNAEMFLADAVESALRQSRLPDEIVVIDDGSNDQTGQVAARYGARIRFIQQSNSGPAAARNRGIEEARGEWIAFLDADDVWFTDKLERQIAFLRDRDSGAVSCGQAVSFSARVPRAPDRVAKPDCEQLSVERLWGCNRIVTSTVLAPRELLREAGGFDERYRGPEDYALWLQLAERAPVWWIKEPLVAYRIVPGSLSQNDIAMRDQELQIHREFVAEHPGIIPYRMQRSGSAAIHYRNAVTAAENRRFGRALSQVWRSVLTSPRPLLEYSNKKPLLRIRFLARIIRDFLFQRK